MPIRVSCQCGKALNVKDEMAGKAVKCPGCGQVIRVPGGQAPAAAPRTPQPLVDSTMDDMFDEEGFGTQVAAACPSCGAEMAANAVLCTKCGFHKETGQKMQAHRTAGVDIDFGELALMKAERDLQQDVKIQKEMLSKAGLPWWGLGLVLFMLGSSVVIAVLAVNASRREEGKEMDFNPMATFLMLCGVAFSLVAAGGVGKLIVHAVKKDATKGQIITLVIGTLVLIGIAVGFFIGAANQ